MIFKSKPKEIFLNFKLYKALKNSEYFDTGFYLNNNKDLIESNWCKYFSPKLHYVCVGFDENRPVNEEISNKKLKSDLLDSLVL